MIYTSANALWGPQLTRLLHWELFSTSLTREYNQQAAAETSKASKTAFIRKLSCDCLLSFLIPQDTGVSVRKRVIKIMKDICVMQPDFPKTSEICVKIIRRIGDEEGIKVQATIAIAVCEQSFPVLSKCVRLTLCVIPPSLATGDECFPRAVVHPASRGC